MRVEIQHKQSDCQWNVFIVADDGRRELKAWHAGDHCDANERRYARERAQVDARIIARDRGHAKITRTVV